MPNSNTARALLRTINSDLGHLDFFTRDDLMQLDMLGHVATITRYNELRFAVNKLLESGKIVELNRTRLTLPRKANRYAQYKSAPLSHQYRDSVFSLVSTTFPPGEKFDVTDVISFWIKDEHLSEDSKRVATRGALALLARAGKVKALADNRYSVLKG